MDVGQPKDFLTGTTLYLNHLRHTAADKLAPTDKRFVGNVLMHHSATVAEGALVGPNVVLGPNTVIESGARLANATVLEGATVKAHAWVKNSIIGWQSTVGRWARLENVTVLGQDVHVDDEVRWLLFIDTLCCYERKFIVLQCGVQFSQALRQIYVNGGKILPHKTISDHIPEPQVIM